MTRGKSLKFNNTKHGGEEKNKNSINGVLINQKELENTNNKNVRIHNGQDGFDVVIDNNKNGPPSVNEAFEMNNKGPNKFESLQSQMSSTSARSTPRYGTTASIDEKRLEVIIIYKLFIIMESFSYEMNMTHRANKLFVDLY